MRSAHGKRRRAPRAAALRRDDDREPAEALVPVNKQLAFPVAPSGGVLCEELFEDAVEQRDGLALFVLGER